MGTRISLLGAAALLCCSIALAMALQGSCRQVRTLSLQVAEQHQVIDSLLARRMTVMDVQMHVTDRSTSKVYGRYNKGTITLETAKKYILEVDSFNIKTR